MATAYLGIGSNVRAAYHVQTAVEWIQRKFIDSAFSPIYRSHSVGFEGEDFLNLVARVETRLQPLELKALLNQVEDRYGRKRNVPKFSDRTLDIDILLYDDLQLELPGLSLPRTEITRFAHVLQPLADLAPEYEHPALQQSIASIWQAFRPQAPELSLVNWEDILKMSRSCSPGDQ